MNRYKKLFSDTVILAMGTFGSKLLVFLLMPLYTALLSPAEYGTAELIMGTANLIMPLACVGITNGIFRFTAEKGSDKEAVFSSSFVLLGIGFAVLGAVGIPFWVMGIFSWETFLIVLYVLFADLQAVCAQYIRAIDRTRLYAVQGILNTVLTIGFNLLFLIAFRLGVTGYVLAVIAGNVCTIAFLAVSAKLWKSFRREKISRQILWELFRFSLPMIPTTICWLITDLSDRYLVTWFCGTEVNGVYSAAYKIPSVVNLLSGIFMQAWQFSAVAQSSDEEGCREFYSDVFRGFLSVIFIGTAGLIFFSRFLSAILLNNAYFEAWRYMPTLLCAAALEAVVSFLATVYMVRKKSMHSFLTAMAGALSNLLLNFLLIPRHGALGAAAATLLGYGIVYFLRMGDVPRLIKFRTCGVRQGISILLLLGTSAIMTAESIPHRYLFCGAVVAVVLAFNLPALFDTFRNLLRFRKEK